MDPAAKKRKSDENGGAAAALTPEDAATILAPFTPAELTSVITSALVAGDAAVLAAVRGVADRDPSQRKLFIRGLGCDTTADSLRAVFSPFGELEEAVVITDKATARSKGYGFLTFRHIDSAVLALRNPSKQIDGRMTVTNLASTGNTTATSSSLTPIPATDRKLFVGNVPADMSSDRLLSHFATYGEIEEGPLGFDKQTGKFRGYALFVYKTVEAARAALVEPNKMIDGNNMVCKLANADSKKGKPAAPPAGTAEVAMPGQYGIPGSGGFSGYTHPVGAGLSHQVNTPMPSFGVGAPGFGGVYGPSSQYGAQGSQYGAQGSGGYGGVGSSLYRMPPGLGGMPTAGQAEGAQYPLSAPGQYPLPASAYQSQHLQPTGSPGRRYPIGGPGYPSLPSTLPPYF